MPTSATGARPPAERGFTLVELMVVLLIVGLAGAAVALTAPDGRPRLPDEAEAFAARLKRAQEEAVLANRPVEVTLDAESYGFRVWSGAAWRPLAEGPFEAGAWPQGLAVEPRLAEGRTAVRFDPTGAAEPARIIFSQEARRIAVEVDAAGNVRIDGASG